MKTRLRRTLTIVLFVCASLLLATSLRPLKPAQQTSLRLAFEKLTRSAKTKAGDKLQT